MTRARLLLVAALAAAGSGCTGKGTSPDRANFALPSAIAVFWGYTLAHSSGLPQPYAAVANESRNDLALIDLTNDTVLNAPVMLRPLELTFADRPALLAGALLGDTAGKLDNGSNFDVPRPSLLVGVSAGSSVLQLVRTWDPANGISAADSVDLGFDVLGIAALPSTAGTARLAVWLAGKRLAVVQYRRAASGDAIEKDPTVGGGSGFVVHGLAFEPAAIATVAPTLVSSGDPAHVYAATLDTMAGGVQGVAEIDVSVPAEPWAYRALGARAPTRLVAAASVQERVDGSVALDRSAFASQPRVTRVYAVLDEASCGAGKRIECGVVVLDPTLAPAPGGSNIPADWSGWMPYRAPIPVLTRPATLAVASPPFAPLPSDPNATDMMAIQATSLVATTGVGLVAYEAGALALLDLGRYKPPSTTNAIVTAGGGASMSTDASRLWFLDANGQFVDANSATNVIWGTPGYVRTESWTLAYQGPLPALQLRAAEAWLDPGTGEYLLALQAGEGAPGTPSCSVPPAPVGCRSLTQVALLWHPALGVREGDIVGFRAARVPGCTGDPPPGTPADLLSTVPREFEARIVRLVPPTAAAPGGAVALLPRQRGTAEPPTPASWGDCWTALGAALAPPSTGLKGLLVSIYAGGPLADLEGRNDLVLTGSDAGYAGRPKFAVASNGWADEYLLQYRAKDANGNTVTPDEDQLAAQCPLADWTGTWPPPTCGGTCNRDTCEQLVLARKARRVYHVAEDCKTGQTDQTVIDACTAKYPASVYPNGPALRFRVGHDWSGRTGTPPTPEPQLARGLVQIFSSFSGVGQLSSAPGGPQTRPESAATFDRSPYDPPSGYRFYVVYPGNQVSVITPTASPVPAAVIR